MTSAQKIKTNRGNAQASTGPRTAAGKTRAAQNARRHGLSLSVMADSVWSEELEVLARAIAGVATDTGIYRLARRIAEAQIQLRQVRSARHRLLSQTMRVPEYESDASLREKLKLVIRCLRTDGPFTPMPDHVVEALYAWPEGAAKFAAILADLVHQLLMLERYERRALSRRKRAIRALDDAKATVEKP
jgi:hypothetical protein